MKMHFNAWIKRQSVIHQFNQHAILKKKPQPTFLFGSKKNADNANKMNTTPPMIVTETKK